MEINKNYNESNIETMVKMPNRFIDLVLTSPPYDDLRDYNGYSFPFEKTAKELYRIVKTGGVVVWIVGDSVVNGSETGTSFKQALYFKECGFKLHDTMIYEKNGTAFPANCKSNRYSQVFEYMFVFSKGIPKAHNLIKDKKNNWGGTKSFGKSSCRDKKGDIIKEKRKVVSEIGYRNNIWKVKNGFGYSATDEIAYKHPAIFPEKLAFDHIRTWTNEGDLVYDCFMGSGTTAKAAICANRNWIGSEISKKYCDIIDERLIPIQNNLFTI